MSPDHNSSDTFPVAIERTYPAPVTDVWNLWTTEAGFALTCTRNMLGRAAC